MKKILKLLTGFILLSSFVVDLHGQADVISGRLKESLISQNISDEEIAGYLTSLKSDGSWDDIDYKNKSITNWNPLTHSRRLQRICQAYNKPESSFFHSKEVLDKIMKIIEFYIDEKPRSDNWWYNAIGAPTNLGPALVLMKPVNGFGIEQSTLEKYTLQLLNYFTESAKKWPSAVTGANKIWLLSSSIDKACVMNNEQVLRENFKSAFEEAAVMAGKAEGIKVDMSFYQHGPQLYCAGYGMSFLSDITYYGALAAGTDYAMTPLQLKIITDALLDGFSWFCQGNAYDYSAAGREISRRNAVSAANLKTFADRLISMNAPRQDDLKHMQKFISGMALFQNPGNRHFWKSDIMVQHGADFYLSARVPSRPTNGTERMNNENLLRKWLPWGAMNMMKEGDEYRNLFPVWDWSRIPGVTSYLEKVSGLPVTGGAYLVSPAEFAGGVSDGNCGLAAYDYSWDGVSARKAWFFTPEGVYCLGAGISADGTLPVITSLNQCFSSGPVTLLNGKKSQDFNGKEIISGEIKWIFHDGFGYIFPSGGSVSLRNTEQTGSWADINLSQSKDKVTEKVFSVWIDHGTKPVASRYEYLVVPSPGKAAFKKWTKKNPFSLITNSSDIQAVYNSKSGIYAIALYNAGSVTTGKGLSIGADKPCLILFSKSGNSCRIVVSDPTQNLKDLNLVISMKLRGNNVTVNADGTSYAKIELPAGDEAGKSAVYEYEIL